MRMDNKKKAASGSSTNNFHDPWGIWAARIVRKLHQFSETVWSFYARLNCLYWRISIGKGCRFWGKMYFHRAPGSTITVGNNCRFRSAIWSNLVGLNRQCMISTLNSNAKITIGDGGGMSGTVVSAAVSIEIGSNVLCGANVTITDTDWHDAGSAPVIIGSNVWLGMNVIVLKGVTIGDHTTIAANSVVTKDIPANVLAAGQPAKVVKHL